MAGFFTVTDVPARRVVQYKRVPSAEGGAVYLEDAGDVYFAAQPESTELGSTAKTLTATPKAGKAPYTIQWYKDDKQVLNVPDGGEKLKVSEPGKYWAVVKDADGKEAVSKAADVVAKTAE